MEIIHVHIHEPGANALDNHAFIHLIHAAAMENAMEQILCVLMMVFDEKGVRLMHRAKKVS